MCLAISRASFCTIARLNRGSCGALQGPAVAVLDASGGVSREALFRMAGVLPAPDAERGMNLLGRRPAQAAPDGVPNRAEAVLMLLSQRNKQMLQSRQLHVDFDWSLSCLRNGVSLAPRSGEI